MSRSRREGQPGRGAAQRAAGAFAWQVLGEGAAPAGQPGDAAERALPLAPDRHDDDRLPRRPTLPFLLVPAVVLWVSLLLASSLQWQLFCGQGTVWQASDALGIGAGCAITVLSCAVVGAVLLVALVPAAKARWRQMALMVACAAAVGLAVGNTCWGSFSGTVQAFSHARGPYELRVESDVSQGLTGPYSLATLVGPDGLALRARVMWDAESDALPLGAVCTARGTFKPISASASGQRLFNALVGGTFSLHSTEDARWGTGLQGLLGPVRLACCRMLDQVTEGATAHGDSAVAMGAALVRGIVLGDRTQLAGTTVEEDFRITGLAHLLAVSGSHLGVVAALCTWLMGRLRMPRRAGAAVLVAATVGYLVLTGLQPSTLRATIMAGAASVSWLAGRRRHSLSALAAAVACMLALNPANAYSLGFGLSVLGVLGICLFAPLAQCWVAALLPRDRAPWAATPALAMTAQCATMPLSIPTFSMISLVGLPCNIVVAPAVAFLLGAGMLGFLLGALWPPVGQLVLALACRLAGLLCAGVALAASVPHAALPVQAHAVESAVVGASAMIALWAFWPLPARPAMQAVWASLAACALLCALAPSDGSQIVVMDVGQGDAILVRDGPRQVLVDTGPSESSLRSALARNRVTHLDAVVLTHFDSDHCGALGALRSLVTVDHVVVSAGSVPAAGSSQGSARDNAQVSRTLREAQDLCGADGIAQVAAGDCLHLTDALQLKVLWPRRHDAAAANNSPAGKPGDEKAGNESSICLLLEYDATGDGLPEHRALLTGDAESPQLAQFVNQVGDIDVLKVGHHGSADAVDEQVLAILQPEAALISVGARNFYGHPAASTLEVLEDVGALVMRTDEGGDIAVRFTADAVRLRYAGG